MGIKYLNQIIKKYAQSSIENIKLSDLFNKIISIDTSIFLYKYQYNNSHYLVSFLKQILKLLKNGITPYYVFDGKPPKEKNELLLDRKIKKEMAYAKIELLKLIKEDEKIDLSNMKYKNLKEDDIKKIYQKLLNEKVDEMNEEQLNLEINKNKKKIISVRKEHINNLIELLEILGIPYLQTNYEAEIVCAQLNRENIVNGCITEDSDYLTNSGNYLLRKFNSNCNIIVLYKFHILLQELKLNNNQFVDFCILCGCDYTSKITGIGPVKALQLIKKYKNIENIIDYINNSNTKYIIQPDFNFIKAREIFNKKVYCKDELDIIKKNIIIKNNDIKNCIEFFDKNQLVIPNYLLKELKNYNKYISKIKKYKNKKKQKKLTNYFIKSTNMITQEI